MRTYIWHFCSSANIPFLPKGRLPRYKEPSSMSHSACSIFRRNQREKDEEKHGGEQGGGGSREVQGKKKKKKKKHKQPNMKEEPMDAQERVIPSEKPAKEVAR